MSEIKCDKWRYKTEEAIPCPFCNGESVSVAHSQIKFLGQNDFGAKKIKMKAYCVCNKCGARGTPVYYIGYESLGGYDKDHLPIYSCGEEAIKLWNTRKPMERIAEQIEFLEHRTIDGVPYINMNDAIEIAKEEGGIE